MDETIHVAVVLGTARPENESSKVLALVEHAFRGRTDVSLQTVRVGEHLTNAFTVPPWSSGGTDQVPTSWQKIAAAADGFLFIIPEYNRGYPGEWKLLVDSLYGEYVGKVAGIIGVSDGMFGGARVVEHVRPALAELGLMALKGALNVSFVKEAFTMEGAFADQAQSERAEKFLKRFILETKRQRIARKTIIS